jgi:hypothetical protein
VGLITGKGVGFVWDMSDVAPRNKGSIRISFFLLLFMSVIVLKVEEK